MASTNNIPTMDLYAESEKELDRYEGISGRKLIITYNISFQLERCARIACIIDGSQTSLMLFENHLRILHNYLEPYKDQIYDDQIKEMSKKLEEIENTQYQNSSTRTRVASEAKRESLFDWHAALFQLLSRKGLTSLGKSEITHIIPGEGKLDEINKTEFEEM